MLNIFITIFSISAMVCFLLAMSNFFKSRPKHTLIFAGAFLLSIFMFFGGVIAKTTFKDRGSQKPMEQSLVK